MSEMDQGNSVERGVSEELREKVKEPDMFRVVIHNDDYTTKEFVVEILRAVFHKPAIEATKIMMNVHKKGRGTVGIYTWDIATTKTALVKRLAKENDFPLKCTIEKA